MSELLEKATRGCLQSYLSDDSGEVNITVCGDCMSPALKAGQQILVRQHKAYFPGDIVAFYSPFYGERFVHRVLGKVPFQKTSRYLIKADNSTRPDIFVDEVDILGRTNLDSINLRRRFFCYMQLNYWLVITMLKKSLNGLRR